MKKFLIFILCLFTCFGIVACSGEGKKEDGGSKNKDGIVVDKTAVTLEVGDSVSVTASPEENFKGEKDYAWTTSDEAIATVSVMSSLTPETARITSKALGEATVTVTAGGKSATVTVTVVPKTVLTASSVEIMQTKTAQFPLENGEGATYSSENDAIATVDANGLITGVAVGNTRIVASKNGKNYFVDVKITKYELEVTTKMMNVLLSDQDVKFPLADVAGVTFESTDPSVATIAQDGKITLKKAGRTILKGTRSGITTNVELGVLAQKQRTVTLSATTDARFNYYGRTKFENANACQEFYYTSSGFDVTFYGTGLEGDFYAGISGSYVPWLSVFVDGESMTEQSVTNTDRILKINSSGKYDIVKGLEKGWHTVKVRKRTAFQRGGTDMDYFGVKSLNVTDVDGYIGYAPKKSDFRIDVYGDSISCGYGNLTDGGTMTSENTDGVMAYHSVFANTIGADITVNACSGWGVKWGNDKGTAWAWPDYWKKLHARSSETYASAGGADMIIINLGENDSVAVNAGSPIADFTAKYVAWLTDLRLANPDAVIICTYGMMGQQQNMKNGITAAVNQMNDSKIMTYFYTNKASGGHPTVDVHKACGQELLNFVTSNNLIPAEI